MTKVRNFVEITSNLPFSEFNFYELYRETFEHSELGRMKKLLPLHEMAESLGLVSKSMMPKRGRMSYFTPEGKVALMFLKMKTQMSFPKLMEELNDERELLAGDRNITRKSGDEARTKRENDIKRRVGYGSKHGMAPDRLKLKTLNDNP